MNIEKAIRKIKEFGLHHAIQDLPHSELTVKAFEMAISALEKQMARSPVNRCATFLIAECPRCNGTVSFHHKHCHWCGQNLDWEAENE